MTEISRLKIFGNSSFLNIAFLNVVELYLVFFRGTEEVWVRRGGKGEGGCGEIFL